MNKLGFMLQKNSIDLKFRESGVGFKVY